MTVSRKAEELVQMELKCRAFNSIESLLNDRDVSYHEALGLIIDIIDDANLEYQEFLKGWISRK